MGNRIVAGQEHIRQCPQIVRAHILGLIPAVAIGHQITSPIAATAVADGQCLLATIRQRRRRTTAVSERHSHLPPRLRLESEGVDTVASQWARGLRADDEDGDGAGAGDGRTAQYGVFEHG